MDKATEFYRSQIGGTAVINYCYTDMPWRLFVKDVYFFFVYIWALPWVLLPVRPCGSGELDELRSASQDARSYIAGLERRERERTGIPNLKVGYNRAARMVESMEAAGVVGPLKSNGMREVLVPPPPEE